MVLQEVPEAGPLPDPKGPQGILRDELDRPDHVMVGRSDQGSRLHQHVVEGDAQVVMVFPNLGVRRATSLKDDREVVRIVENAHADLVLIDGFDFVGLICPANQASVKKRWKDLVQKIRRNVPVSRSSFPDGVGNQHVLVAHPNQRPARRQDDGSPAPAEAGDATLVLQAQTQCTRELLQAVEGLSVEGVLLDRAPRVPDLDPEIAGGSSARSGLRPSHKPDGLAFLQTSSHYSRANGVSQWGPAGISHQDPWRGVGEVGGCKARDAGLRRRT